MAVLSQVLLRWDGNRRTPVLPMDPARFIGRALIFALMLAALSGCSDPGTVRVVGRVTYNGQPVEGAQIGFFSDYRDDRPAAARTDADGRYEVQTYISSTETLLGAFPNEYGVVVFKYRRPFPERVDSELARRFAPMPIGQDQVELEAEEVDLEDVPPSAHHFSPGFKFPPYTDAASVREMLSLTNRQLRGLPDEELMQLRYPPDWVRMGMTKELAELARERSVGRSLLPTRYAEPETSGLHASVKHGEQEPLVFDFALTDDEPTGDESKRD
jgi:hypothetical protein